MGLSSISLPYDSVLTAYLKGLKDSDILLTTGRIKVTTGDVLHKVNYMVMNAEIKHHRIETAHDLLKALLDEERLKCPLLGVIFLRLKQPSFMSLPTKKKKPLQCPPIRLRLLY